MVKHGVRVRRVDAAQLSTTDLFPVSRAKGVAHENKQSDSAFPDAAALLTRDA